ncbi:DNA adenine methylase [bacterium]|nr:DNA adenine methylase [bacterium]
MAKRKKSKYKQYKNKNKINAKPFVKWAGGKTQILDELARRLPVNIKNNQIIDRYVEPFVGDPYFLKEKLDETV